MLTFYHHRGIRITDRWLAIDGCHYPLRELGDLHTSQGPINRTAVRVLGAGGSVLATAVLLLPALPVLITAALGLTGLAGLGLGYLLTRLYPRERRLYADVHGVELLLFATHDSIELGKVTRALRRAVERDASPRHPDAGVRRLVNH